MASTKDNIPAIKSSVVRQLHAKNHLRTTEAGGGVGLFNERLVQDSPSFAKSDEEVIKANGNAWIILGGSDRPGNFQTGYGAKGHHGANKIDIVIGRESSAVDCRQQYREWTFTANGSWKKPKHGSTRINRNC